MGLADVGKEEDWGGKEEEGYDGRDLNMRCEVIGCVGHARGVRGEGEGKEGRAD